MAIGQTGASISLSGKSFYKGGETHNGTLLDMHENCIKYGYSELVKANGDSDALVPFGSGVWLDTQGQDNKVYAGSPTATGAVGVFAGIIEREPAISDSIVWNGKEIASHQNGIVVVEGVLQYKTGKVYNASASLEDARLASFVYPGFVMVASASNGEVYFSPKATVLANASDVVCGRVLRVNKSVGYVDVFVSPSLLGGLNGTATITSFTAPTATVSTVSTVLTVPTKSVVKYSYKKTAATDFTDIDGEFEPVLDEADSNYKLDHEFAGLDSGTAYTFKVVVSTPNGLATTTVAKTTA